MPKQHKNPMYACFAFFPDGAVKRWKYVTNLNSFSQFLTKSHPAWKYFNVYEKGSKKYLKRFYPGNLVPKTIALLLLLLTQKFTCDKFTCAHRAEKPPMENTCDKSHLQRYGFNNTATISTENHPKSTLC